jgi:hypothetical protein
MKRREFISLLGGAAAGVAARGVEPENRTCGYMIDREQASSAVALTM